MKELDEIYKWCKTKTNKDDIFVRNVLVEKSPLKVKIILKREEFLSLKLWYENNYGEIFYAKETSQPELASLAYTVSQNDAKKLLLVTTGEFKGNVIIKQDCKVLSGQYEQYLQ